MCRMFASLPPLREVLTKIDLQSFPIVAAISVLVSVPSHDSVGDGGDQSVEPNEKAAAVS